MSELSKVPDVGLGSNEEILKWERLVWETDQGIKLLARANNVSFLELRYRYLHQALTTLHLHLLEKDTQDECSIKDSGVGSCMNASSQGTPSKDKAVEEKEFLTTSEDEKSLDVADVHAGTVEEVKDTKQVLETLEDGIENVIPTQRFFRPSGPWWSVKGNTGHGKLFRSPNKFYQMRGTKSGKWSKGRKWEERENRSCSIEPKDAVHFGCDLDYVLCGTDKDLENARFPLYITDEAQYTCDIDEALKGDIPTSEFDSFDDMDSKKKPKMLKSGVGAMGYYPLPSDWGEVRERKEPTTVTCKSTAGCVIEPAWSIRSTATNVGKGQETKKARIYYATKYRRKVVSKLLKSYQIAYADSPDKVYVVRAEKGRPLVDYYPSSELMREVPSIDQQELTIGYPYAVYEAGKWCRCLLESMSGNDASLRLVDEGFPLVRRVPETGKMQNIKRLPVEFAAISVRAIRCELSHELQDVLSKAFEQDIGDIQLSNVLRIGDRFVMRLKESEREREEMWTMDRASSIASSDFGLDKEPRIVVDWMKMVRPKERSFKQYCQDAAAGHFPTPYVSEEEDSEAETGETRKTLKQMLEELNVTIL